MVAVTATGKLHTKECIVRWVPSHHLFVWLRVFGVCPVIAHRIAHHQIFSYHTNKLLAAGAFAAPFLFTTFLFAFGLLVALPFGLLVALAFGLLVALALRIIGRGPPQAVSLLWYTGSFHMVRVIQFLPSFSFWKPPISLIASLGSTHWSTGQEGDPTPYIWQFSTRLQLWPFFTASAHAVRYSLYRPTRQSLCALRLSDMTRDAFLDFAALEAAATLDATLDAAALEAAALLEAAAFLEAAGEEEAGAAFLEADFDLAALAFDPTDALATAMDCRWMMFYLLPDKKLMLVQVPSSFAHPLMPRKTNECTVYIHHDMRSLRTAMSRAGLDDATNVGSRVVTAAGAQGSARRALFVLFDASRAFVSTTAIAASIAALPDPLVCVDLSGVASDQRKMLVVEITKATYQFEARPPTKRRRPPPDIIPRISYVGAPPGWLDVVGCILRAADIQNEPANLVTPLSLAKRISAWFPSGVQVKARILKGAALASEGMGLIRAVGMGSIPQRAPCMLTLESAGKGRGGRGGSTTTTIVLVGKGVVFDSGGMALKSFSGMIGMHGDKSGAAVAAAVFHHFVTASGLPAGIRLVTLLPLVENAISGSANRPGDVFQACDGKTVEIVDPDAEGRLILADAIAYSARFKPDYILDFATMTGYGGNVHHDLTAAVYAEDDALASMAVASGAATGERCWRMPDWPEYMGETASQVADLRNSGWSSSDEGYMGAMFIRNFVPEGCVPGWVHFDISKNTTGSRPAFTAAGVATGIEMVGRLIKRHAAPKAR